MAGEGGGGGVIDNRGKEVPVCTPEQLPAGVFEQVRMSVKLAQTGSIRWTAIFVGCVLLPAIAFGVLTWGKGRGPSEAAFFVGVVTLLLIVMAVILSARVRRFEQGEDVREAMLAIGRCPSCAYTIDAARVEADGCATCPECGAAWRMAAGEAT